MRSKMGKEKNTLNWHSYFHHIKSAICSWHSLLSLGRFSQFRHGDEERRRINQINSQFGKFRLRPFSSISIPSLLPAPSSHSNYPKKRFSDMMRHVYGGAGLPLVWAEQTNHTRYQKTQRCSTLYQKIIILFHCSIWLNDKLLHLRLRGLNTFKWSIKCWYFPPGIYSLEIHQLTLG